MSGPLIIVGDVLLDRDVDGRVDRFSPEAPVPVLVETDVRERAGGAGLAATLAGQGGRDVVLVTALGDDDASARVRELLTGLVEVVVIPASGATAEKSRYQSGSQRLLRVDRGGGERSFGAVPDSVNALLTGAAAVLVSDYGGGLTSHQPLRRALDDALRHRHGAQVWDPHPRGTAPLAGVALVTPNGAEAAAALGEDSAGDDIALVSGQADRLVSHWGAGAVAVTVGRSGAVLSYGSGSPLVVPAPPVIAADTCGAGDAFAAAAAAALATGAVVSEAVAVAVAAASSFLAAGGVRALGTLGALRVAPRAPAAGSQAVARVRARGGTVVATGGCFDLLHAGHVATLEAARRLGDCLVVCLNSDESVRRLKGAGRPLVPAADRARVLSSLSCVDAVEVFEEDTPTTVLDRLRPDLWVKGGDYAGAELPEAALIAGWGGRALLVPYRDGLSTTHLLRSALVGGDRRTESP